MVFSIFIKLCNHHHNLILEYFHHSPSKKTHTHTEHPYSHSSHLGGDVCNRPWLSCDSLLGLDTQRLRSDFRDLVQLLR